MVRYRNSDGAKQEGNLSVGVTGAFVVVAVVVCFFKLVLCVCVCVRACVRVCMCLVWYVLRTCVPAFLCVFFWVCLPLLPTGLAFLDNEQPEQHIIFFHPYSMLAKYAINDQGRTFPLSSFLLFCKTKTYSLSLSHSISSSSPLSLSVCLSSCKLNPLFSLSLTVSFPSSCKSKSHNLSVTRTLFLSLLSHPFLAPSEPSLVRTT